MGREEEWLKEQEKNMLSQVLRLLLHFFFLLPLKWVIRNRLLAGEGGEHLPGWSECLPFMAFLKFCFILIEFCLGTMYLVPGICLQILTVTYTLQSPSVVSPYNIQQSSLLPPRVRHQNCPLIPPFTETAVLDGAEIPGIISLFLWASPKLLKSFVLFHELLLRAILRNRSTLF